VGLRPLVPAVMRVPGGFASPTHFLLATQPVHSLGSPSLPRPRFARSEPLWCRTIAPACHRLRRYCPRLRSRLTLGRLTLPRNPQAFGVAGSHSDFATHSGIRSCVRSTCLPSQASRPTQRSPTILVGVRHTGSTASVRCLSLATLSVPVHSTSELLRKVTMMAAYKPTSWLFERTNCL